MTKRGITITEITIQGFRGYLKPTTFETKQGQSLAVFAPNGRGKSSLIDAFEYYLSEKGTLKRLGERKHQTHAGPKALPHVSAGKEGIMSTVHFKFKQDDDEFEDPRPIPKSGPNPIPEAAKRVNSCVNVPIVIRGHELRHFVEATTPEERYGELTTWFDLDSLLVIQKNLRQLRREVDKKANSTTEIEMRWQDVSSVTNGVVSKWNESRVLAWLNTHILAHLANPLDLKRVSREDPSFQKLVELEAQEKEQTGLGTLRQISDLITGIIGQLGETRRDAIGQIATFENAVLSRQDALAKVNDTRSATRQAVFDEVWASAKKLFEKNIKLGSCPVCDTDFRMSPHGSRNQIRVSLDKKLANLKEYHEAEEEMHHVDENLTIMKNNLSGKLEAISSFPECSRQEEIITYLKALQPWKVGEEMPASREASTTLANVRHTITNSIGQITKSQDEHTYGNALRIVQRLLEIKADLERIDRIKSELRRLCDHLDRQTGVFGQVILDHINRIISRLQNETRSIYKDIQGPNWTVPPIRIDLPSEGDRNQQRAYLRMDFADNHKNVIPGGYLSDSQIHTLALAMRLAAIRIFNPQAPIIALDDIVTSYDVDHRKTIAGVLAESFADFQIFLVTHDEQFFNILRNHLPQGHWNFKRITKIRPGFGPVIHGHHTPDQVINDKLNAGESAAIEIRQVEENWLEGICRAFRTSVDIRQIGQENNHSRAELAMSLGRFLKDAKITPPKVPKMHNRFLESVKDGYIENLASHFPENPNKRGSIGDEKVRWAEFKYFRDKFACPKCGKRKFQRPLSLEKPVCIGCQEPFTFLDDDTTAQPTI